MPCAFIPFVLEKNSYGRACEMFLFISTTAMPLATKLGKVVTCHEGFASIKSCGPLITWHYKITWQTNKLITSPLRNACDHQTWKFGDLLEGLSSINSQDCLIMWSCKFNKETGDISTITMLMVTKLGSVATYLKWFHPWSHLITWSCEIMWQTKNISNSAVPVATKLGMLVTYNEEVS